MNKLGCVYLVGAGPGDPGLITVKGASLLSCCDCVIYDVLASVSLLNCCPKNCEKLFVGKQKGKHSKSQEEINSLLIEKARCHSIVVRLKGGDPYIFGRGGEEALALKDAGIPYEVVPGVTSASAVLASAGIPVTHRLLSRSFHVVTAHTSGDTGLPEDFFHLTNTGGTVIVLMGASQIDAVCKGLMQQGWNGDTPAAVIQNGTLPNQKTVTGTLQELPAKAQIAGISSPAVIAAGKTAALNLLSSVRRPLDGIRIGIIGTDSFTHRLKGLLDCRGARADVICRMQVIPCRNKELEESFQQISNYTWLVFTSANGVRLYLEQLLKNLKSQQPIKADLRCLGNLKIAAVGKETNRALEEFFLHADYVPDTPDSQSLADGLVKRLTASDRVLIPRAKQGQDHLPERLKQAGIFFCSIPVYDVVPVWEETNKFQEYDFFVFASPSGVSSFFSRNYPKGQAKFCCIGAVTARVLENHGVHADLIPKEASAKGIVEQIEKAAGNIISSKNT